MRERMKLMKSWIALTALVSLLGTGCTEAAANTPAAVVSLTDIGGHWAEVQIKGAVAKRYVDGYEDGTFRPEKPVSRAEFIKMLASAAGVKPGEPGSNWYDPYVTALKGEGVLRDRDFQEWNGPMTRAEMAKLAVRMAKKEYADPKVQLEDNAAMTQAVKLGLIQGLAGGELAPEKTTTRAQTITVIERVLQVKAGDTLPVDALAVRNSELANSGSNFESVFGVPLKVRFPLTHDITSNIKVTYKGLIVLDMDKSDDPMVQELIATKFLAIKSDWYKGKYVFIVPTVYDVTGTGVEGRYSIPQSSTFSAGIRMVSEETIGGFPTKETGRFTGKTLAYADKQEMDAKIPKGEFSIQVAFASGNRVVFY